MDALNNFWSVYSNLVLTLGTNALLALSIWLTLSCGMLAMANAAFMGIGAYTSAILTMTYGVPFPVAIAAGMAAPALTAFVIGKPTLRLSGVYLAMATLGFGEVVRIDGAQRRIADRRRAGPERHPAHHPVVARGAGAGAACCWASGGCAAPRSAAPSRPSRRTKPPPA